MQSEEDKADHAQKDGRAENLEGEFKGRRLWDRRGARFSWRYIVSHKYPVMRSRKKGQKNGEPSAPHPTYFLNSVHFHILLFFSCEFRFFF